MKISYAITVCNEAREFRKLLDFLVPLVYREDEIVVLQDVSKESKEVNKVFIDFADYTETRVTSKFEGDFAAWKNMLNSYCKGDYIFQLDADEIPEEALIRNLPMLLDLNPDVDLFWVPRWNTVEGITIQDLQNWHWALDNRERINWPDYQGRIYRNAPGIRWEGKVHEKIVGYKKYSFLPDSCYLHHDKSIEKQRSQNNLYSNIQHNG